MTSKTLTQDQEKALLAPYRARIDDLDAQIVALLGQRFGIISDVAKLKAEHGIAPILPYRVEEVVRNARAKAEKAGVNPDLVEKIYRIIIDTACRQEEDYAHASKPAPQSKKRVKSATRPASPVIACRAGAASGWSSPAWTSLSRPAAPCC